MGRLSLKNLFVPIEKQIVKASLYTFLAIKVF